MIRARRGRHGRRLHIIAAAALSVLLLAGPAAPASATPAAAPNDPVLPPTVTVSSPGTDHCPQRDRPPPAVDTSENVPPGSPSPAPLPVQREPAGGKQLAGCGFVLPAGAPALPSDISAAAWMIADLGTGSVLAAKDPHGRYRPASTLKLLTMAVMLENLPDLNRAVAGTRADSEQDGSRVGIGQGGTYTVKQLLLFLMMGSGNDVANALARANGGYDKTVADMNAMAAKLGARDTRAATVSGLDGPGQSTSAYDLALIARHDMASPPFPELISKKYSQVPPCCGQGGFGIANDNKLLFNYPGALGGKTGFTDDAGNTYVGMAQRDGRRLVVTMLDGTQYPRRQWMQAASLLDWGFALPPTTPSVGTLAQATPPQLPASSTSSLPSTPPGATTATTVPEPTATSTPGSAIAAGPGAAPGSRAGRPTDPRGVAPWVWALIAVLLAGAAGSVIALRRSPTSGRHAAGARPTDPPATE